jgi:hypothetical protein
VRARQSFQDRFEPVPHGGCYVVVPPEIAEAAGLGVFQMGMH